MATTTVILDATMVGTVISPGPDQFVVKMVMTQSQWPPYQVESHLPFPLPFGTWRSGRFVLRDLSGAGMRVINISTQFGAFANGGGHALMTNGQTFQFRGDLILECLPTGQVWEIDFSDVPVAQQAA